MWCVLFFHFKGCSCSITKMIKIHPCLQRTPHVLRKKWDTKISHCNVVEWMFQRIYKMAGRNSQVPDRSWGLYLGAWVGLNQRIRQEKDFWVIGNSACKGTEERENTLGLGAWISMTGERACATLRGWQALHHSVDLGACTGSSLSLESPWIFHKGQNPFWKFMKYFLHKLLVGFLCCQQRSRRLHPVISHDFSYLALEDFNVNVWLAFFLLLILPFRFSFRM